jgi:hypothetical protein
LVVRILIASRHATVSIASCPLDKPRAGRITDEFSPRAGPLGALDHDEVAIRVPTIESIDLWSLAKRAPRKRFDRRGINDSVARHDIPDQPRRADSRLEIGINFHRNPRLEDVQHIIGESQNACPVGMVRIKRNGHDGDDHQCHPAEWHAYTNPSSSAAQAD